MKRVMVIAIGLFAICALGWAQENGVIGTAESRWIESSGETNRILLGGSIIPTRDEIWQWRLLNAVRANPDSAGWPQYDPAGPLEMNYNLTDAARFHSQEMITNKYFNHDSKDASGTSYENAFQRIKRFGYTADSPGGWVGENIAGCSTVEIAMNLWMNSTGHRENIMKKEFTEIGVGIKVGGPYGKMFTNDFGYRSISFDLAITEPESNLTYLQYGDTVILKAWVSNIGKTHAFPVYVGFYDGDPKLGGKLVAPAESVSVLLRPQEQGLAQARWLHHVGSQHQVYVVVDPDNKFKETNENNNSASMAVVIGIDEAGGRVPAVAPGVECRPNPARSRVGIEYGVRAGGRVDLTVYNSAGRLVKKLFDGEKSPGRYRLVWRGDNDAGMPVSGGVYFIRCTTAGSGQIKKIVLVNR